MPLSPRSPWSSRSWHGERWKTGRSGIDVRCSAPVWTFVPGGLFTLAGTWSGILRLTASNRIGFHEPPGCFSLQGNPTVWPMRSWVLVLVLCWFCQWCFTFFEPEVYSGRVAGCLPTITGTSMCTSKTAHRRREGLWGLPPPGWFDSTKVSFQTSVVFTFPDFHPSGT